MSQAITKAELHRRFREWLAMDEQEIGLSDAGKRTEWVHVRDGERWFVLHADTNRSLSLTRPRKLFPVTHRLAVVAD